MTYEGKVYRPWPEANSLLIQVSIGCSNNNCTFCDMFTDKTFRRRSFDDISKDIDEARRVHSSVKSIFLIDGNVMVLKTDFLLQVVTKIKETFPELERLALYSEFNDFRRKSLDQLKQLKAAGVDMAYVGLESGDSVVLENIKKKMTFEQAVEGAALAKEAGIEVLASFIFGLGGKSRSKEHIEETVRLLNILKPEQIAPMALAIQPGTELEREVNAGEFIQATPMQILEEEKYLLENMHFETYYWGDHGNNISPMRGPFPNAKDAFLNEINTSIASNPVTKQEILATNPW